MKMDSNHQAYQHGAVMSPNKPQMKEAMRVKSTLTLSILLFLAGFFMSIIQIGCTVVAKEKELWGTFHNGGTGIWCGVLILFSGILGLQAANRKTNPWVISFLVFNVLSVSALAPTMIGLTGVDLATNRWSFCSGSYYPDYRFDCSYWNTLIGMTVFLLLDAIFVFAISIWGIVMNSIAIQQVKACSCYKDVISQARTVLYIPGDQMPSTTAGQSSQQYFPHQAPSLSYILPMNGAPISPPSCTNQPPHVVGTPISAMAQTTYVVAQAPYPVASIGQTGQSTNIVASTQTTLPEPAFSGIGGPPAYERLN